MPAASVALRVACDDRGPVRARRRYRSRHSGSHQRKAGARNGTLEAATFQSLIGVSLFLVTTLAVRGGLGGVFSGFRAPAWMWLGGAMGFVIVSAITYAPRRVEPRRRRSPDRRAAADGRAHRGLRPLRLRAYRPAVGALAGIALLAAGATLVLKR